MLTSLCARQRKLGWRAFLCTPATTRNSSHRLTKSELSEKKLPAQLMHDDSTPAKNGGQHEDRLGTQGPRHKAHAPSLQSPPLSLSAKSCQDGASPAMQQAPLQQHVALVERAADDHLERIRADKLLAGWAMSSEARLLSRAWRCDQRTEYRARRFAAYAMVYTSASASHLVLVWALRGDVCACSQAGYVACSRSRSATSRSSCSRRGARMPSQ